MRFITKAPAHTSPDCRANYFVFCRERFRKAKASGPHILIITIAQEAKPTKASMTARAISIGYVHK